MSVRKWSMWAAPVVAVAVLACTAGESMARPGPGGGRSAGARPSGGRSGGGYNRGGGYYRGGYGRGYGYGPYLGLGYGYGYYGGAYDPGYANNYYYDNTPTYGYVAPTYGYVAPDAAVAGTPPATQSYYSGPAPAPTNGPAQLNVVMPVGGTVSFGSYQTQQAAGAHLYATPSIDAGSAYSYTMTATWTENGQPVTRTKTVKFHAGERVNVDFTNPSNG